MTVYIDKPTTYPKEAIAPKALYYGRVWSHLWADSLDELHAFARRIGLKRDWFQNRPNFPHYDVTPAKFQIALTAGAQYTDLQTWLREHRPDLLAKPEDAPTQPPLFDSSER